MGKLNWSTVVRSLAFIGLLILAFDNIGISATFMFVLIWITLESLNATVDALVKLCDLLTKACLEEEEEEEEVKET